MADDDYVPPYMQGQQPVVTTGTQGQPRILISPPKAAYVPPYMRNEPVFQPSTAPATTGATNPAVDFAESLPGGFVSGLGGVLSATGASAQAEMSEPITAPTPQEADLALQQNITGSLPLPQGKGGQYGRTVGQFLASAPFSPPIPGVGPIAAGVGAVGAGLASEAAGQATAGTRFETPARLLAPALVGLRTPRAAPATEAQALNTGRQIANVPTTEQLLTTGAAQMNVGKAAATSAFSPGTMEQLASNIEQKLKDSDLRDYTAGGTFRAVNELRGENSAAGIQKVRSVLGRVAGAGGEESRGAQIAQGEIDGFLKNAEPEAAASLEEGRGNYAAGMRSKASDVREQVADLRVGRAGYGGNARAVNAVRQVLFPVVEKYIKGEKNGLSPDEFKAMYDIVHGTTTTNTLRGAGMLSPEKGSLPLVGAIEVGRQFGPEAAAGIAGISWLSNKLANVMTTAQINRLGEMIRKRSPLYEKTVKDAADRYTKTMNDFASNPTRQSLVKFLAASRNLSAGLRKDGIPLSAGDLLKGVEAPDNSDGTANR